jgi:RNA recognition motif-containing protein
MTSIFVAKLDFGVDNPQLQALFETYGKVNKATVALDRETGKSRGFGFVEMFNDDEAQAAIENLDGHEVNGRPIAVKEAEDRGGSKPAPRRDGPAPRREFSSPGSSRSDSSPSAPPSFTPEDSPSKEFPKKKMVNRPKTSNYEPSQDGQGKKTKLNPYKKSGKDSIKIDDDDLDEDFDLFGRDEDDDDEDYSKYLVNADEDDDDYDDDDFDDDEEYDED